MNDLKELQSVELEILLEIDRICKKHNIKYFLCSGTLLGAIRHKGFIPWDDDIDISMPFNDYKKFKKICKKELNKHYFLQTYSSDNVCFWYAKIRKNNTKMIEQGGENLNIHQGVWVDIFPLIAVSENDYQSMQNKANKIKRIVSSKKSTGSFFDLSFRNKILKFIPDKIFYLFIDKWYETIFKQPKIGQKCCYLWADYKIRPRFDYLLFDEIIDGNFENNSLPIPVKYDEYLSLVYGDYMTPPPVEKRKNGGCHIIVDINLNS